MHVSVPALKPSKLTEQYKSEPSASIQKRVQMSRNIQVKSFKNRMWRQKQFGSKILEVVTITEGSRITVVTQYYLKEDDK